jgi:hypothetical protein
MLKDHLTGNNILSDRQFGFREGRSTESALHTVVSDIYESLDRSHFGLGIFLDLSKAFDSLDRDILLIKLEAYGVRGNELSWFASYLSQREVCTVWEGEVSGLERNNFGVPQGSTLGPALFLLFINDLDTVCTHSSLLLFADDSNIFSVGPNLDDLFINVNSDLIEVELWLRTNRLTLNLDKTHYVLFHGIRKQVSDADLLDIKIGETIVERRQNTKFLGVFVTEHLGWVTHVQYLRRKLSKYVGIFYQIRDKLDKKGLLSLYNALVYPTLLYCNTVWGSCYKTDLTPLFMIQKKLMRCIAGSSYGSHTAPLFSELNCLNVYTLNQYLCCNFVFRCLEGKTPFDRFQMYHNNNYNTRINHQNVLVVPRVITELGRKNIIVRGAKFYNEIPLNIRSSQSVNIFKFQLKRWLMEH